MVLAPCSICISIPYALYIHGDQCLQLSLQSAGQ